MHATLALELANRFDELRLRLGEPLDLTELNEYDSWNVTLIHEVGQAPYQLIYSPELTGSALGWAKAHYLEKTPLLVVGPRVTERSAENFRTLNINFLDQAGNAYITFGGVHIDVRGRHAKVAVNAAAAAAPKLLRSGVNLFSTKRAQVIFSIVTWDNLLRGSLRNLASVAGVSLGQAQETLELLKQYEFLSDRHWSSPSRREDLIDLWAASYPTGLGSTSTAGSFSGEFSALRATDLSVYVSGEAAVPNLLRPESLTLYSSEFPTELIRTHHWRRNDEAPTIFLRRQFWNGSETQESGVFTAPPLLVYADLLSSNDSRQREVAQQFRSDHDGLSAD